MIAWLLACAAPPAPPPAAPAPRPAPSDAIYFLMVDRFADGRPDPPGTVDRADPQAWHGGDLQGILDRLDHLEALGVGAVWLTPLADTRDGKIDQWGAFHGYWTEDPAAMEPRFGTFADARALSDALHARGMKLYLDLVLNHVGYDAPVTRAHPDWFHGLGDVKDWDDAFQRENHDVHGLPDLAQEKPEVDAWLREAAFVWLDEVRPDGFRVDAVRHLPEGWLATFGDALRERAGPGFELLGEVFDGDPVRLAARARADRLDAVFDFPLHYALRDTVCGEAGAGRLAGVLAVSDYGGARPVTLLDNHDTPRILSLCGGDVDRVAAASAVMFGARGTPSVTWGTEAGLAGAEEPDNRADLPWGPDGRVGAHALGETLRGLTARRGAWRALREGDSRVLALDERSLVFARVAGDEAALVTVNLGAAPVPVSRWPVGARAEGVLIAGVGAPVEAAPPEVPAGAVLWERLTGVSAPGPGGPVTVSLAAELERPRPDERWVLTGANPALGGWDPARGVPLVDGRFTFAVPEGTVVVGKLVRLHADGSARWEEGPDRSWLVTAPALERAAPDGGPPVVSCGSSCLPARDGRAEGTIGP